MGSKMESQFEKDFKIQYIRKYLLSIMGQCSSKEIFTQNSLYSQLLRRCEVMGYQ